MAKSERRLLVIHNAIEVEKFLYNEEKKIQLLKEYHIPEDCFVVGQVSRLHEKSKNQSFLCEGFFLKSSKKNQILV